MSRKYRQQGYQDSAGRSEPRRREKSTVSREGPRSPKMPGLGRVIRCAMCGGRLPLSFDEVRLDSQCPSCSADLHSCKNCVFFNPTSRFECEQPIAGRISPKDKRAHCEYFEIRSSVEKITTNTQTTVDPRQAFENLFKS